MSPSTSNTPPQSNEGAGSDLAPTHAATTVVDSTSKQVGAALSDNNAIIEEFRTGSKIDHPTGGIEDIENLEALRTSLIGYSNFLVTYHSSENNLRKALDPQDDFLRELLEKQVAEKSEGNIRAMMSRLLGQLQETFLELRREKDTRELTIIKRVWAVARGEGRSTDQRKYTRNGKIRFYSPESENILREHFPNLVQYIG